MKNLLLTLSLLIVATAHANDSDVKAFCEAQKYSKDPHFQSLDDKTLQALDNGAYQGCLKAMEGVK